MEVTAIMSGLVGLNPDNGPSSARIPFDLSPITTQGRTAWSGRRAPPTVGVPTECARRPTPRISRWPSGDRGDNCSRWAWRPA